MTSRNLLDRETSPYLLQHRGNPVHWQPWSPAILAEAQAQNRPILLSVGYAACHWCHVMAHESFENPAVARLINDHFIAVKVDREERPDIDSLYQSALALMGQQGGWPLTMFLLPDGRPFWGGTYFPPQPRYGRPSFTGVLREIIEVWTRRPARIQHNAEVLQNTLARHFRARPGTGLTPDRFDGYCHSLLEQMDPLFGGLKGAPKFPQVPLLSLLWRAYRRHHDPAYAQAVRLTLDNLCLGGLHDHLGGGFARYSTDEEWLVPHFEKMLYDTAQLIDLLTCLSSQPNSRHYAQAVELAIGWLRREMSDATGAFCASLDADSEGEEGRYYVWPYHELEEALPEPLRAVFIRSFDVSPHGNWEHKTILRFKTVPDPRDEFLLAEACRLLLLRRAERTPPARDDKCLTDWNGLVIHALAQAAFRFDRPDWLKLAERAYQAVQTHLGRDHRLFHSSCRGRVQAEAMLDDYAFMIRAALALYETTGRTDTLDQARLWLDTLNRHYWDEDGGGYFFTADDAPGLILRSKILHDAATPCGNGVMVEVLARLFLLTGEEHFRQRAERIITACGGGLDTEFPAMTSFLTGWELLNSGRQLIIVGLADDPSRAALIRAAAEADRSALVLQSLTPDQKLPPGHPAAARLAAAAGATAFLCHGPVCGLPVQDSAALSLALSSTP